VLVVDDDPLALDFVAGAFEGLGFSSRSAGDILASSRTSHLTDMPADAGAQTPRAKLRENPVSGKAGR
jgi:CheY-like chemotaxis protein